MPKAPRGFPLSHFVMAPEHLEEVTLHIEEILVEDR